ncbi:MAG TPA: phosphoribosylanthranilate isomerase [Anaerolineae bacterium]|nr:phosphoribosylanthranilate isomerase [Anaerolineae bacterium]
MAIVKICGLTNLEDAHLALKAGADMLGFIFYEPSPRYVSPEAVKKIIRTLREEFNLYGSEQNHQSKIVNRQSFVGVFVNHPPETVRHILDFCNLDLAQLHGDESPDYLHQFNGRAYKAINPRSFKEAEAIIEPFILPSSAFILLDAFHPILRGGTGRVADWEMAAKIARRHKILLAGGLSPGNVAEAIQQVKPWGVDVSGGVEACKGKKDPTKLKAFIQAAKAAFKTVDGRHREGIPLSTALPTHSKRRKK